ncbi:hypothetical protein C8Q80DRAFT_1272926 [Daedaleopsis nitida]|nr:hypothetical protein C8Q80DRAFT_1272926 [Daedaleopsis nitida]
MARARCTPSLRPVGTHALLPSNGSYPTHHPTTRDLRRSPLSAHLPTVSNPLEHIPLACTTFSSSKNLRLRSHRPQYHLTFGTEHVSSDLRSQFHGASSLSAPEALVSWSPHRPPPILLPHTANTVRISPYPDPALRDDPPKRDNFRNLTCTCKGPQIARLA